VCVFRHRYRKWLSLLSVCVCKTYNVGGEGRVESSFLHLLTGPVQSYFFLCYLSLSPWFSTVTQNTHPSEECCSSLFFKCLVLRHSWRAIIGSPQLFFLLLFFFSFAVRPTSVYPPAHYRRHLSLVCEGKFNIFLTSQRHYFQLRASSTWKSKSGSHNIDLMGHWFTRSAPQFCVTFPP
jgi:hypothetical protein